MRAACLILLLAMPLAGQDARRRIVVEPGSFPLPATGSRLLWIGAHPDDEVLVAPLLATLCVEQGVRCSFLILTRGEKGECLLAGGCGDLAAIRSAEMASAASFYGADLTLWDYPDAALQVEPSLVDRVASLISSMDPDVVLTLDPRHGSTCHSDHKILGSLVLEAVARVQNQPLVYLAENHVDIRDGGASIRFSSVFSRRALVFRGDWDNLVQNAAIHASQFGPTQLQALRTIPSGQRTLLFLPVTPGTVLDPLQICVSPKIE